MGNGPLAAVFARLSPGARRRHVDYKSAAGLTRIVPQIAME
jgi:hypothetical protein